jgi:fatty acid desaturase
MTQKLFSERIRPPEPPRARRNRPSRPLRLFFRFDGPTWVVALVLYCSWALLVAYHASLPWWVLAPAGGYVVAWHFSLQHEAIHAFRSAPQWLRWAVVMPPIGLWLPFPLYFASHRQHHRNAQLTVPGVDTESVYWRAADWQRLPAWRQAVLMANQTLAGRVLIGPVLRLEKLLVREVQKIRSGDRSHLKHWLVHLVLVAALFAYISAVCGMPWWQYLLLFAWPAFCLGWVRPFIEHRYGEHPDERTAIIESNRFWSLLFLNNNYHAIHHRHPRLAWWRIPAYWRRHHEQVLRDNGRFHFPGYAEVARRWLTRPVFKPVHPPSIRR